MACMGLRSCKQAGHVCSTPLCPSRPCLLCARAQLHHSAAGKALTAPHTLVCACVRACARSFSSDVLSALHTHARVCVRALAATSPSCRRRSATPSWWSWTRTPACLLTPASGPTLSATPRTRAPSSRWGLRFVLAHCSASSKLMPAAGVLSDTVAVTASILIFCLSEVGLPLPQPQCLVLAQLPPPLLPCSTL